VQGDDLVFAVANPAGDKGSLSLSPKLNEFRSACTIDLPKHVPVQDMACPWCSASLLATDRRCELCGAPTARILVKTSGDDVGFHVCTRNGCHFHGLDDDRPGLGLELLRSV
jgi:hypothetical protein